MEKSFVERAKEAFDKNKDLSGLEAIIEGVDFYLEKFTAIVNEAEEADVGLVVHAMNAICASMRNGIPGAAETEQLVAAMLSTTIISIPRGDEREGEI